MSRATGTLSPPPRAPSPNPPRPSISSNRSARRTGADFEAALLDPKAIIFLSDTPTLGEKIGSGSPPRKVDHDAPQPVEKRSFEEDMNELTVTPVKQVGTPMNQVGVIPPTPATMALERKVSGGGESFTPIKMLVASRKTGPSLGIDAELQEGKSPVSRRKSTFRSPGTASSPDLATLVRKAKEANANGEPKPPPPTAKSPQRPINGMINSHSSQSYASTSSSISRDRSSSHTSVPRAEDSWDKLSNGDLRSMPSGERMATISEGSGRRSRQSSGEDGFKSMRTKARGVLGRMFGNSSPAPASSQAGPSSRPFTVPTYHPPLPPVPPGYIGEADSRRSTMTSAPQASGQVQPYGPPTDPTPAFLSSLSVEPDGRVSTTPTDRRQVSSGNNLFTDKPLPIPRTSDAPPPSRTPNHPARATGHTRQGATMQDESSSPESSLHPSPQPPIVSSFSDDVAGMLDRIGENEPAKELGLPPDSLRDRERSMSSESRRFPLERKGSGVVESPGIERKAVPAVSPVPARRTSSLPGGSPKVTLTSQTPLPSSSPRASLHEEANLLHPRSISRRSSTSSRRRTRTSEITDTYATLSAPLGSPLLVSDRKCDDFAPPEENLDATIRGKHRDEFATLSPNSIRLLSPQPDHVLSTSLLPLGSPGSTEPRSTFIATSPWGAQSPRSETTPDRLDPLEFVDSPTTPNANDDESDEERGRRLACEFLEEDFRHIPSHKVAMFLGGPRHPNHVALRYYMQYFDMKGQSLVESFRDLCQKLVLKAESQEIDRIIEAFSARYYDCNPTTVFGSSGVVHTVTGAMLMLNTDLHIADLNKHMSRTDFVRNSMRAIQESMPPADRSSTPDVVRDDGSSFKFGSGSNTSFAPSSVNIRPKPPTSLPNAPRSASAPVASSPAPPVRNESGSTLDPSHRTGTTTISSFSYSKAWEADAENALKEIYSQVRADRILLPTRGIPTDSRLSTSSFRNRPYDSDRGKTIRSPSQSNDRVNALKRGSIRGVPGLINNPYQTQYSSSDGRLSPTSSFANSSNDGFSSFPATLGFASNLSHTVIREQEDEVHSIDSGVSESTLDELDEDELALLGAPWAKEGILWRKSAFEAGGKKSASKGGWKQYFVVIQKSDLHLFTFGESRGTPVGGTVGGGNWLNNANSIGSWNLMHAVAGILPKPGLGADRPHSFSMTYPNGQIDLFSAGTDDLVIEWIATANYWAARRSRQPLKGGVSNMEYGWTRALEPSADDHEDKASVRSGRSNASKLGGTYGRRTIGSGFAEKMHINDWKPPPAATMPSPLDEETQLEVLMTYVRSLVEELEGHKTVQEPMSRMYTPGSKNGSKAKQNWEAKSKYIHSEVYKYETYVEALRNAIALRVKKQGERKLERSLARSMTSLHRRYSLDEDVGDNRVYAPRPGLRIDSSQQVMDDGEEEAPNTPLAARTRGLEDV